jgi:hypothetical protein
MAFYDEMASIRKGTTCARRTGRLAFVFLLLFIAATFATAFHHHADGGEHHDCPVCAAAHHHSSVSSTVFSLTNQQPISSTQASASPLLHDSIRVALLPCRAPPA